MPADGNNFGLIVGPTGSADAYVSCARGELSAAVPWADMKKLASGCHDPATARSISCFAASNAYCTAKGYHGGLIQEVDGVNEKFGVVCFNAYQDAKF